MDKNWIVPGTLALVCDGTEIWLDLHGYSTETAMNLVHAVIEVGWKRGLHRVTLVHGAAYVTSPMAALFRQRGSTKWAIRRALNSGEFKPYVYYSRSKKHDKPVDANRISLALKPNPEPTPTEPWPPIPSLDY